MCLARALGPCLHQDIKPHSSRYNVALASRYLTSESKRRFTAVFIGGQKTPGTIGRGYIALFFVFANFCFFLNDGRLLSPLRTGLTILGTNDLKLVCDFFF